MIIQAGNNTNELMYHTLSASVDITDSSDWNAVNFDPNYKGVDYGPAIAYGSNTWVVGGKNVSDGDSHITLMRSLRLIHLLLIHIMLNLMFLILIMVLIEAVLEILQNLSLMQKQLLVAASPRVLIMYHLK